MFGLLALNVLFGQPCCCVLPAQPPRKCCVRWACVPQWLHRPAEGLLTLLKMMMMLAGRQHIMPQQGAPGTHKILQQQPVMTVLQRVQSQLHLGGYDLTRWLLFTHATTANRSVEEQQEPHVAWLPPLYIDQHQRRSLLCSTISYSRSALLDRVYRTEGYVCGVRVCRSNLTCACALCDAHLTGSYTKAAQETYMLTSKPTTSINST